MQRCIRTGLTRAPALTVHSHRLRVSLPSRSRKIVVPKVSVAEDMELLYSGESFYDLLGVSPTADRRTIKRAYLNIMKECHPDTCDFDEANDFCALMNEVYETLSDPARRATYDALSGFSDASINPFNDPTHIRDQVFVDEFTCIGCRNCCNVCPSTFEIEEDYGRARVTQQGKDLPEKQQEAIDTCPVSCIHWVTSPQLSLLEAAMAKMERIAVWSMGMSSSGNNKDVFLEAELAWQKRRAELRRRRAAATGTGARGPAPGQESGWGSWWNNVVSFEGAGGASFYDQRKRDAARGQKEGGSSSSSSDEEAYDGAPLSDKDARGIAALAARAARASRTWKICQETASRLRNRPLQLTPTTSGSSMDEIDIL